MKISTEKLYTKTRIFDNYPTFGRAQLITDYYDDAADNLYALIDYLNDYEKTKTEKTKLRECLIKLGEVKRAIVEIYNQEVEEQSEM